MRFIDADEIKWHKLEMPFDGDGDEAEEFAYKSELTWALPVECVNCKFYVPYEIVPNQGSCPFIKRHFISDHFFCGLFKPNQESHYDAFWEDRIPSHDAPREPDKD